jgi:hypothetical protein
VTRALRQRRVWKREKSNDSQTSSAVHFLLLKAAGGMKHSMVRVLITQTIHGSIAGIQLSQLGVGLTYDVDAALGTHLLRRGTAVLVDPTLPAMVHETPGPTDVRSRGFWTVDTAADRC